MASTNSTAKLVARTTKPEAGNKYYIRKASGGYSDAIKGSPTDKDCDVLANCVGYAYGRFNEIGGWGSCKYLSPVNAENFIKYKGSLEVGQTPRLGACMVWQKGATLSGSDGAGHVAIVERIISDTEIITSESGYNNSKVFWTQTRKKGSDGNWGQASGYKFLGFIYNPAPCCDAGLTQSTSTTTTEEKKVTITVTVLKKGSKGEAVKALQALLNARIGAELEIDGSFGSLTDTALRKYQASKKLVIDGSCGAATWMSLLS